MKSFFNTSIDYILEDGKVRVGTYKKGVFQPKHLSTDKLYKKTGFQEFKGNIYVNASTYIRDINKEQPYITSNMYEIGLEIARRNQKAYEKLEDAKLRKEKEQLEKNIELERKTQKKKRQQQQTIKTITKNLTNIISTIFEDDEKKLATMYSHERKAYIKKKKQTKYRLLQVGLTIGGGILANYLGEDTNQTSGQYEYIKPIAGMIAGYTLSRVLKPKELKKKKEKERESYDDKIKKEQAKETALMTIIAATLSAGSLPQVILPALEQKFPNAYYMAYHFRVGEMIIPIQPIEAFGIGISILAGAALGYIIGSYNKS